MIQADPDAVPEAVLTPSRLINCALPAVAHLGNELPFSATRNALVDEQRRPPLLLSLHLLHCTFLI